MAYLYISEYAFMPYDQKGNLVVCPTEPALVDQPAIVITGTSAQSLLFNINTKFVIVSCDTACSIQFGTDPVANTSLKRLAANETRFYGIDRDNYTPGSLMLAVIANV